MLLQISQLEYSQMFEYWDSINQVNGERVEASVNSARGTLLYAVLVLLLLLLLLLFLSDRLRRVMGQLVAIAMSLRPTWRMQRDTSLNLKTVLHQVLKQKVLNCTLCKIIAFKITL